MWFEVPDARQAAEALAAEGVSTLTPPFPIPTGWASEIRDPCYLRRSELGRR